MKNRTFKISSLAVDNRVTVYIVLVLLAISGVMSYNATSKEAFPEVKIPYFAINTIYPGTSPEDIENLITRPLEKKIKTVDGIRHVDSSSKQDVSRIFVKFETDADEDQCSQDLKDAVDEAMGELPTDLDKDPQVKRIDVSEMPVLYINLSGDLSLPRIKELADDLQDEIEGLGQVTRVDIVGALDREIQVDVDLFRMQAAGITFDDIQRAIANENLTASAGTMDVGKSERTVRVKGEFETASEIGGILVKPGIFLNDIATVRDGFAERASHSRMFGNDVISLQVIKKNGENLIETVDEVDKILDEFKTQVTPNLKIAVTGDSSQETKNNLSNLFNTIILSFLIVTLVLMFFMGVKNALFAGIAVPLSMCVAFIVIAVFDFSMNMVVQMGLIIALGILVDNSIVVVENMFRHMSDDPAGSRSNSIKAAVGEVAYPVLAGTLTTLAPFAILSFWPGVMGKFLFFLPVTLIISLTSSLFVAYVFNPVFAHTFMRPPASPENGRHVVRKVVAVIGIPLALFLYVIGRILPANLVVLALILYYGRHLMMDPLISRFQTRVIPAAIRLYRNLIDRLLRGKRPLAVIGITIVLLLASIFLVSLFPPNVSMMPNQDPTQIYVYVTMPTGTPLERTDEVAHMMEEDVTRILGTNNPDVEFINTSVAIGAGKRMIEQSSIADPRLAKVTVGFVEYQYRSGKSTTRQYLQRLRDGVRRIPGAEIIVQEQVQGPSTGDPVNIEITGEDLSQLAAIQDEIFKLIEDNGIKGLERLKSDLDVNNSDILIDIDRARASRLGLSTAFIANRVRTALYGREVSKLRDGDEQYPIVVRLERETRENIEALMNMELSGVGPDGPGKIPLSAVASVTLTNSLGSIYHRDFERVVTLSSNVLEGYNANRVIKQMKQLFDHQLNLKPGYRVTFTGEQEEQQEALDFLSVALFLGVGFIFLILVTQFNSLSRPVIVLSQVMFSFIGILLGIVFTGMEVSILMTGMGVVAVGGIVVNNGILLIDYTDQLLKKGVTLKEALIEACSTRLTPVLLTAISTVIGLVPLAIGFNIQFDTLFTRLDPNIYWGGNSAQFWSPLAWTIIFGLMFATFLTLFVVPSMTYIMNFRKKAQTAKKMI
jgi:multidrug efflux pump subunit AcrB